MVTAFQLPVHHAFNRYFREQDANMALIIEETSEKQLSEWADRYRKRKLSSKEIAALSHSYEQTLARAHAFGIGLEHKRASPAFPNREQRKVAAFFMEPMALGQGWFEDYRQPYVEQALYLRSISVEFRRKKAVVGIGASGVVLTKHLLSRVYERTEVDHTEFATLVHEHIGELLAGLALAESGGIWITEGARGVTAVPFANGLLIVNLRMILGREDDGDFGWRSEIPHFRNQTPHISANLIVNRDPLGVAGAFLPTIGMCGTTYLNLATLSDDQADYYYAFEALARDLGEDALRTLASTIFHPSLLHERRKEWRLKEELFPRLKKVNDLLRSGWLRAEPQSVAMIMSMNATADEVPNFSALGAQSSPA